MKSQTTYGIYKFKIPTKEEQISSLGLFGETSLLKKLLIPKGNQFYENLKPPKDGDWLMTHKEYGQTFDNFLSSNPNLINKEANTIYLVSLSFSDTAIMNSDFIMSLRIIAESYFYGMKIKLIYRTFDLSEYKIKTKMNIESNKIQINSNQILSLLYNEMPKDAYSMIAFTDQDLFIDNEQNIDDNLQDQSSYSKEDQNENEETDRIEENIEEEAKRDSKNSEDSKRSINQRNDNTSLNNDNENKSLYKNIPISNSFTFGLSFPKLRISIFSFARYDPVFYTSQENKESNNEAIVEKYFSILQKRSCKVLIKEVGLMMGLKNCIYFKCSINGFYSMEEFDNKPLEPCPICLRKIYTVISSRDGKISKNLSPNILYDRWVKMKDSLEDYFIGIFEEELDWYKNRIDSIKDEF